MTAAPTVELPDVIVIMPMHEYVRLSREQMLSLGHFLPKDGTVGVNKENHLCWFKDKEIEGKNTYA